MKCAVYSLSIVTRCSLFVVVFVVAFEFCILLHLVVFLLFRVHISLLLEHLFSWMCAFFSSLQISWIKSHVDCAIVLPIVLLHVRAFVRVTCFLSFFFFFASAHYKNKIENKITISPLTFPRIARVSDSQSAWLRTTWNWMSRRRPWFTSVTAMLARQWPWTRTKSEPCATNERRHLPSSTMPSSAGSMCAPASSLASDSSL